MDSRDEMVGESVAALLVNEGEQGLYFVCKSGKVFEWLTEGDCCSRSWWADIVGVDDLFDCEIQSFETIPLPDWVDVHDGRSRQDVDKAYGFKLTTDRGWVDFIFRNSSNGYYGGWMNVQELDSVPNNLVEIRQDWQA